MRPHDRNSPATMGVTMICPVPHDIDAFCHRLVLFGLWLSPAPCDVRREMIDGVEKLVARGEACTGHLFATDGYEAPAEELLQFVAQELQAFGGKLIISGGYVPSPGKLVETQASFEMSDGVVLMQETRVMTGSGEEPVALRSRSDFRDNVVSFPSPVVLEGFDS